MERDTALPPRRVQDVEFYRVFKSLSLRHHGQLSPLEGVGLFRADNNARQMEAFRDIRRLHDRWFIAIIILAALTAALLVALDIPDLGSLNGDSCLSIMKSIAFVGLVTNGC